jgi:hypothetical protein
LRGDQNWSLAVQSLKSAETRYFAKLFSQSNSGSSEMVFETNSNFLVGHEIEPTVTGIQPNTNITGILTANGVTTISLGTTITSTIPAGTIIEFSRGASPVLIVLLLSMVELDLQMDNILINLYWVVLVLD